MSLRGLPSGRPGITLIEVLLGMTIFLVAIVAISRLVDMGVDSELDSRMSNRGARLAQAKMAEIEAGVESLSATGGQFDGDDQAWSWTMSTEQVGPPNLYLVRITVTRDLKGKPVSYTLAQMLLDPAVMGSAAQAVRPDSGELP